MYHLHKMDQNGEFDKREIFVRWEIEMTIISNSLPFLKM